MDKETVANGFGVLSVALGATELFMPSKVAEFLGIDEGNERLIQLMGIREILAGVAIFMQRKKGAGLWGRVGGDALDLALLYRARENSMKPSNVTTALGTVAAITALDIAAGYTLSAEAA